MSGSGLASVGVGREGLAPLVSAGAVFAAGDVNGLRLSVPAQTLLLPQVTSMASSLLAPPPPQVMDPVSLDSLLTWDVDDVTELFHFLTQKF